MVAPHGRGLGVAAAQFCTYGRRLAPVLLGKVFVLLRYIFESLGVLSREELSTA